MKLLYYRFMRRLCWILEDIHDLFYRDHSDYYPSSKWEAKVFEEIENDIED